MSSHLSAFIDPHKRELKKLHVITVIISTRLLLVYLQISQFLLLTYFFPYGPPISFFNPLSWFSSVCKALRFFPCLQSLFVSTSSASCCEWFSRLCYFTCFGNAIKMGFFRLSPYLFFSANGCNIPWQIFHSAKSYRYLVRHFQNYRRTLGIQHPFWCW